jgi:hypothetical protein
LRLVAFLLVVLLFQEFPFCLGRHLSSRRLPTSPLHVTVLPSDPTKRVAGPSQQQRTAAEYYSLHHSWHFS